MLHRTPHAVCPPGFFVDPSQPRPDGTTYLSYAVELVPCPIFPLPLVERKVRKEVPRMLHAVKTASQRSS